jgi:hypothetical protein
MNIDIGKVENIREDLEDLGQNDVMFIEENGNQRYVVMPIEMYDAIEDAALMVSSFSMPQVKIASAEDFELSYDEYERIKNQIMDAVEKTLMPKPEKLN